MTTYDKARWLVIRLNVTKVAKLLGMSRHTLYKRLALDEWKTTEIISVNHYYDIYKKSTI